MTERFPMTTRVSVCHKDLLAGGVLPRYGRHQRPARPRPAKRCPERSSRTLPAWMPRHADGTGAGRDNRTKRTGARAGTRAGAPARGHPCNTQRALTGARAKLLWGRPRVARSWAAGAGPCQTQRPQLATHTPQKRRLVADSLGGPGGRRTRLWAPHGAHVRHGPRLSAPCSVT